MVTTQKTHTNIFHILLTFAALVCLESCTRKTSEPAPESTVKPVIEDAPTSNQVFGESVITGTITFAGTAPKPSKNPAQSFADCAAPANDPNQYSVRVNNGNLMNVFVHVKNGLPDAKYDAPAEPKTLDQVHCAYIPRVFGIQIGQPLDIINSDSTLHNVHSMAKESSPFNVGMPKKDMKLTKTFDKTEVMVTVKCDVHPWMRAYVGVLPHPFYDTTNEQGAFTINKLPAGSYTIEAWHETLGTQTKEITLDGKQSGTLNFEFK